MSVSARILAHTIRIGGNPVARIVNRTADLSAKASNWVMERRYKPGKVREEISRILRADGLTCDWIDLRGASGGLDPIRTDIVRTRHDGQLYVPGKLGRLLDLLQPSLTLPPSLRKIIEGRLRKHSISPRLRNAIKDEMLCAIVNENDPDINRELLLNLLALAKSMTERFESDPRAIRPYSAQLKDIAKGAEVDLGRFDAALMLTTLSHLILLFPEGSFGDAAAIRQYGRVIRNMITKARARGIERASIELLMKMFSLGLVESIPEVFAIDRREMDLYWEVLLYNYSDALSSMGVNDVLRGAENPRSDPAFPAVQQLDLPKEILMDKEKLAAVLEVAVKYPAKFELYVAPTIPLIYMIKHIHKEILTDNARFLRVFGFIKTLFEQGEEVRMIMMAYRSKEARGATQGDPAWTVENCISRLIVSMGIMFRYADERIVRGNNFSSFFDFSRADDLELRIKALSAIETLAKKRGEKVSWASLLAKSDPDTYRPMNPLLRIFINIIFPDEG